MRDISSDYNADSIFYEMRKLDLEKINGELYEINKRIALGKIIKEELSIDDIAFLKSWTKCEYIFKNPEKNEYLFANKIDELEIL